MIQRRQTLFLLQLIFLSLALLFVPLGTISNGSLSENIVLAPFQHNEFQSTWAHSLSIVLNFVNLLFAFATIFLYKKRELQIKLCYLQMILWLLLGMIISFFSFAEPGESLTILKNYFGLIICVVALLAGYLAAKNVKKDIDLLKSADRIR